MPEINGEFRVDEELQTFSIKDKNHNKQKLSFRLLKKILKLNFQLLFFEDHVCSPSQIFFIQLGTGYVKAVKQFTRFCF